MANIKVCLDAGHYGKYNRSPAVNAYYESDMAWKLTMLQKKYLEQYGFKVVLTRSDKNKDLGLTSRGRMAKGCVLFISNHSNAVGHKVNESVDYVAVYHLTNDNATKADNISKVIAEKIAPTIAETMGTKQGFKVLSRLSDYDRNNDGFINDNYYGVLHGVRSVDVPGLILEHSFHTNTSSTKWLLDDSNLDRLARAEAKVIADYFGLSKIEKVETTDDKKTSKGVCNVEVNVLKKGMKGGNVYALQALLIGYGYSLGSSGVDGSFGPATDKAVRAYQKAKGLTVDGIIGPATWKKLLGNK